jgi:Family of unknown function (DUF6370)
MRKLFPMMAVAVVFSFVSLVVFAAEVKTIVGDGQCAKCSLKETAKCQNAVVVDEAGKKVTYYLAKNKVSNDFHKNVCTEIKKVKATGDVEEKDGKMVMTATSIELAQ